MNHALRKARMKRADEGFTLIELLIVIVVLGILAAVVVFALGSVTGNAKASACNADAKQITTAVQAYNAQHSPNNITTESTGISGYAVTLSATPPSTPAVGAAVVDATTGGTIANSTITSVADASHFVIASLSGFTSAMGIRIAGVFGTSTISVIVPVVTGSGITLGSPSTYAATGTQAAALVAGGYLNAWPSNTNGYALSLSTTTAGHVMVYIPATSTSGVDYNTQSSSTGCNSL